MHILRSRIAGPQRVGVVILLGITKFCPWGGTPVHLGQLRVSLPASHGL
jgi:hypothetical protein